MSRVNPSVTSAEGVGFIYAGYHERDIYVRVVLKHTIPTRPCSDPRLYHPRPNEPSLINVPRILLPYYATYANISRRG